MNTIVCITTTEARTSQVMSELATVLSSRESEIQIEIEPRSIPVIKTVELQGIYQQRDVIPPAYKPKHLKRRY